MRINRLTASRVRNNSSSGGPPRFQIRNFASFASFYSRQHACLRVKSANIIIKISLIDHEMDVVKRVNPEIHSLPTIQGLKLIRPKVFPDERGFFCESYNVDEWKAKLGFDDIFLQDNHSFSKFGVIRGLHAQKGMGKLVSVIAGSIFDVAIDIRPGSPTYGKWHGVVLDSREKCCFWIPDGFLHGFQCISEEGAHVVYKCTAVYDPKLEFGINPFDEQIGIVWPVVDKSTWIISERDQKHPPLDSLLNATEAKRKE